MLKQNTVYYIKDNSGNGQVASDHTKSKKCTLKDIARRSDLSCAAVSQILNNRGGAFTSEATKKLVRSIAEELGYKQNFSHKLQRGDRTNTVALLMSLPRLEWEQHIQSLSMHLTELCNTKEYATYVFHMTLSPGRNLEIIEKLIERGTDHFILIGLPKGHGKIISRIEALNRSWIAYGNHRLIKRQVGVDVENGTTQILQYFREHGISDFKMFLPGRSERISALRAFYPECTDQELHDRYLCIDKAFEEPLHSGETIIVQLAEIGYRQTRKLLETSSPPQALVYLSDYTMQGGIRALYESGIIPGRDVVLAGFNNTAAVQGSPFRLISVDQNIEQVAGELFAHLFDDSPCRIKVAPALKLNWI